MVSSPRYGHASGKPVILRSCHAAVAAVFCAAAACGELPLPTTPSSRRNLTIRGTTLLMPGSRGKLTAWLPEDGQLREVRATWSVEGDAISLTSSGVVTANRPVGAIVRARYGEHAGVETVHVVTNVSGTWRGSISIVDCWRQSETILDPCQGHVGITAPIVVDITQSATADNFDNLRADVRVLTPPAAGRFIGATDSSGQVFLDGNVERSSDSLGGALKLRWMLEEGRLVPFTDSPRGADMLDVLLSTRVPPATIGESWRLSSMSR